MLCIAGEVHWALYVPMFRTCPLKGTADCNGCCFSKAGWFCTLNLSATKTCSLLRYLEIGKDVWDICSRRYTIISASFCCHSLPIFRQDSWGTRPWCGTMASCSLSWKGNFHICFGCAPVLCVASGRTRLVEPWSMSSLHTRRLTQTLVGWWVLRTGTPRIQQGARYECGWCLARSLLACFFTTNLMYVSTRTSS